MVSFISFVFAATINKLPLTKRERGFISAFLPTAAPADKGLGRCDHWHIFNDHWHQNFPESLVLDSKGRDSRYKTRNRTRNLTRNRSLGYFRLNGLGSSVPKRWLFKELNVCL